MERNLPTSYLESCMMSSLLNMVGTGSKMKIQMMTTVKYLDTSIRLTYLRL